MSDDTVMLTLIDTEGQHGGVSHYVNCFNVHALQQDGG